MLWDQGSALRRGWTTGRDFGTEPAIVDAAHVAAGAAEILGLAGELREKLACETAGQARKVYLTMLRGRAAVEVAIVDRQGEFLARVGE